MPGTGYVEMGLAAGVHGLGGPHALQQVDIERLMVLGPQGRQVQVVVEPGQQGDGDAVYRVYSRGDDTQRWMRHAQGTLVPAETMAQQGGEALAELQRRCSEVVEVEQLYRGYRQLGLDYGGAFCGVTALWAGTGEALGQVELSEPYPQQAEGHIVHPALLDSCIHVLGGGHRAPRGRGLCAGAYRDGAACSPGATSSCGVMRGCGAAAEQQLETDLVLYDSSGQQVGRLAGAAAACCRGGGSTQGAGR